MSTYCDGDAPAVDMTTREEFVKAAFQALVNDKGVVYQNEEWFASKAVRMADALIKELNK